METKENSAFEIKLMVNSIEHIYIFMRRYRMFISDSGVKEHLKNFHEQLTKVLDFQEPKIDNFVESFSSLKKEIFKLLTEIENITELVQSVKELENSDQTKKQEKPG